MKNLIMLIVLLAFAVPVLADDVSPPVWAGVDGSCTVVWDFTAEDPMPTCYIYTPELTDPPDPMFERDYYGGEWDAATSTYILDLETRFYIPSPVSDGASTTFNIQVTFDTDGDYQWTFAELWTAPEELDGEYMIGTDESYDPDKLIDLGDGRTVGVWTVTLEEEVAEYSVALLAIESGQAIIYEVIIDVLVHDGDPPTSGTGTRCGGPLGPIARNPVPENEYLYAPLDTDLSWDPPEDEIIGITYDVYFGTEPNELKPEWYGNNKIAAGISETTVLNSVLDPVLEYETWYYWRVDTWDPNEGVPQLYEGREWTFRTAPERVVIVGQPQDAVVPEGDDAVFTVVAVNDETYQWYYSDTPDGAGTLLTGETSDILVVSNVQLADEGYYYCEVMNPAMPDATSDRARLLTERMMAHWKLDKNLKDEVSSLNDGTSPMTMKYSTDGIDGSAAQIEETDRYIIIDNNIGTFPGVTVSAWINPTDIAGWHVIIDTLYTGESNIAIFQEDDLLMGEVLDSGWVEGTGVVVGAWQHAALVHSSVDEVLQLYLNGELISEDVADPDTWAQVGPLTMGAYVDAEDPNNPVPIDHFAGLLDDVRIYNYALSCVQVATLYTGFMPPGTEVCCGDYDTDLSGPEDMPDCIVDIYDIVAFVQNWWLECNIVPDCEFELP